MLDHWMRRTPGLKLAVASGARSAYALLRAAIDDPDPVVVLEPRILYGERDKWELDRSFRLPLGRGELRRKGGAVAPVTCGAMLCAALEAAKAVDAEVIDLLSLWPWDQAMVLESVARTGRLVTLEEAPKGTGWGGCCGGRGGRRRFWPPQGATASHHLARGSGAL